MVPHPWSNSSLALNIKRQRKNLSTSSSLGNGTIEKSVVRFISVLLTCNSQQNLFCPLSTALSQLISSLRCALCSVLIGANYSKSPTAAVHRHLFTSLHTSLHLHLPQPILIPVDQIDWDTLFTQVSVKERERKKDFMGELQYK